MSKTQKVLEYMQTHDGITGKDAYERFGLYRLSGVIFNLRRRGYKIVTIDMDGKDRDGNDVAFAKYVYRGRRDDGEKERGI